MKLPDKRTHRLDEVSKSWGCDPKDILQYWMEDELHCCVYVYPPILGIVHSQPSRTEIDREGWNIKYDGYDDAELSGAYYVDPSWEKELKGCLYKGEIFELNSEIIITPSHLVETKGGYDEYYAVLHGDGRDNTLDQYDILSLSLSDICMTNFEKTRFETFCKEGSKIAENAVYSNLSESKERTYLNIIGGLLKLLQNRDGGRYKQDSIIKELESISKDNDKVIGLSESKLKKVFPEAKRLFK